MSARPAPSPRPAAPPVARPVSTGRRGGRAGVRLAAVLLLAAMLAGCGSAGKVEREPHGWRAAAARGEGSMRAMAARQGTAPGSLRDAEVVALGYRERLRLGLGGPFCLVDHARSDPRLPAGMRALTVWSLLDATAAGRAYQPDPWALAEAGADSRARGAAAGTLHARVIERAMRRAADPRAAELALRLAYRMAAAAHDVGPRAPALADRAAALARDRELARRDALRLFAQAEATGRHPFDLAAQWRIARQLWVEAPTAAPPGGEAEAEAARLAPGLAEEIRGLAGRLARGDVVPVPPTRPWLDARSAARLAMLTPDGAMPPRPPLVVALQHAGPGLRRQAPAGPVRRAVGRLLERGRTEERFAAEHARVVAAAGEGMPRLSVLLLEAAVGMRPYAQERPWLPGAPAPSAAELERRFGLARVTFDRRVPQGWRPYYRRTLADALEELRLVFPGAELSGLAVRIGSTGREAHVLATHEPSARVLRLPPERGIGVIGHELAHDLDWQLARRRYDRRGQYATDYAVRTRRGDRLAAAARSLPTAGVPGAGSNAEQTRYVARPAELFARSFDGYLAALLARHGRSNGALTTVQDGVLLGHGGAIPPAADSAAFGAFLTLLDAVSPLPPERRAEFVRDWGPGRPPGVLERVKAVLEDEAALRIPRPAPDDTVPDLWADARRRARLTEAVEAVERRRAAMVGRMDAAACAGGPAALGPDRSGDVRRLVHAAAEARIRGIARRHAPPGGAVPGA